MQKRNGAVSRIRENHTQNENATKTAEAETAEAHICGGNLFCYGRQNPGGETRTQTICSRQTQVNAEQQQRKRRYGYNLRRRCLCYGKTVQKPVYNPTVWQEIYGSVYGTQTKHKQENERRPEHEICCGRYCSWTKSQIETQNGKRQ